MASELYVETLKGLTSGANANKVIIPSGQTLYAPGHVIQVVEGTHSTETTTTSTSDVASGLSVTITPSSVNSKILIVGFMTVGVDSVSLSSTNRLSSGALYRGGITGTSLQRFIVGHRTLTASSSGGSNFHVFAPSYLDSPSTTSATTYMVGIRADVSSGGTTRWSLNNYESRLVVMEIAG